MPLQDEERLFIETMRELNRQAAKMQAGESYKNEKGRTITPSHTLYPNPKPLCHHILTHELFDLTNILTNITYFSYHSNYHSLLLLPSSEDQNEAPKMDCSSGHHSSEPDGMSGTGLGLGGSGGRLGGSIPLQTTHMTGSSHGTCKIT